MSELHEAVDELPWLNALFGRDSAVHGSVKLYRDWEPADVLAELIYCSIRL